MEPSLTSDQRADTRASRQHGAITWSQAISEGLTRHKIQRRVGTGRWIRVARKVYVVAGSPDTPTRRATLAVLAGPPGTALSHLSAAAAFGLVEFPPLPQVTVPVTASGQSSLADVHRSTLGRLDLCEVCLSEDHALPATNPARTLIDCAAVLDFNPLCDLVDSTLYRRLTTPTAIHRAMARASRSPGRKGLGRLEEALKVWTSSVRPGSPAEARTLRWLERWGLPTPERQYKIRDENGKIVARGDFVWPRPKVLLEYDGERWHGPRRWTLDGEREAKVVDLGWTVVRADRDDLRPSATRLPRLLGPLLGVAPAA